MLCTLMLLNVLVIRETKVVETKVATYLLEVVEICLLDKVE